MLGALVARNLSSAHPLLRRQQLHKSRPAGRPLPTLLVMASRLEDIVVVRRNSKYSTQLSPILRFGRKGWTGDGTVHGGKLRSFADAIGAIRHELV